MTDRERRRVVRVLATLRGFREDAKRRDAHDTGRYGRAFASHTRGMRDGYALAAKGLALALRKG